MRTSKSGFATCIALRNQGRRDSPLGPDDVALLRSSASASTLSYRRNDHDVLRSSTDHAEPSQPPDVVTGGLAVWQQDRAIEMLNEHLGGDLALADLAKECALSPGRFMRAFKRSFGVPVRRYLLHKRVEAAKSLLLHSNDSLLTVALEVGFTDEPAFNRSFREIVGTFQDGGEEQTHRCRRRSTSPRLKRSRENSSLVAAEFGPPNRNAKQRHFQSRQGLKSSKRMGEA